jgi:hypothetical protein
MPFSVTHVPLDNVRRNLGKYNRTAAMILRLSPEVKGAQPREVGQAGCKLAVVKLVVVEQVQVREARQVGQEGQQASPVDVAAVLQRQLLQPRQRGQLSQACTATGASGSTFAAPVKGRAALHCFAGVAVKKH